MIATNKIWIGLAAVSLGLWLVALPGCDQVPLGGPTAEAKAVIPEELALDISEFPDDDTDPDLSPVNDRPFRHPQGRVCHAMGAVMHGFGRMLDQGLRLASALNHDLVDPENPHLEGTLHLRGREIPYKADFSPFDIDGDGVAEGSGRFDTEPVAVRIWVIGEDGPQRFHCALINTRPSEDNVGAGQAYLRPEMLHPQMDAGLQTYVVWDRTDPAYRWNEAYTVGRLRGNMLARAGHHLVELRTLEDESVEKTVRSTTNIEDSDFRFSELMFSARTIRGTGVALVNSEAVGEPDVSIVGRCVALGRCDDAPLGSCDTINAEDLDYLEPPVGGETDWPADFPTEPTF